MDIFHERRGTLPSMLEFWIPYAQSGWTKKRVHARILDSIRSGLHNKKLGDISRHLLALTYL